MNPRRSRRRIAIAVVIACIASAGLAASAAADVQTVSVLAKASNGSSRIYTYDQAKSGTGAFLRSITTRPNTQQIAYGSLGYLYSLDGGGKTPGAVTINSDAELAPGLFVPVSTFGRASYLFEPVDAFAPQLDGTWFHVTNAPNGSGGVFGTAQNPFTHGGDPNVKFTDFPDYDMSSVVGFQRNGQDMAVVAANVTSGGIRYGMPVVYDASSNPHPSGQRLMSAEYVAVDGNRVYMSGIGTSGQPVVGVYQLGGDGTPVGMSTFPVAGGGGPMDVDTEGDLWVAGQDRKLYEYSVSAAGDGQIINTIDATPDLSAAPMSLQIEPPLTISSRPSLRANVGRAVNFHVKADHGKTPYTFSVLRGNLPAGLKLSPKGVLSGTPHQTGRRTVTIKVVDSGRAKRKQTATAPLAFDIQPRR